MGMAMVAQNIEDGAIYSLERFQSIHLYFDRDLRRNGYRAEIIVNKNDEDAVVTGLRVNKFRQGVINQNKEYAFLDRKNLENIAEELAYHQVETRSKNSPGELIKELRERIIFLENIVYGVLKVDPEKVEGLRKIRE